MFVKINEFDAAIVDAVREQAPRPRWSNAVHGLAGLAFLAAWLPLTLLCWSVLGTMILLKLGVDASHYAGRCLFGRRSA